MQSEDIMIKHIKCDIFESGANIICHQVNCQGVMGSGIAKQVREKYPYVYAEYKRTCDKAKNRPSQLLGFPLCILTEKGYIANIFSQENYGYDGKCYTDYNAIKTALSLLRNEMQRTTIFTSIAIPYLMGCARGGGDWNIVYKIIEEIFADYDGEVLICEYNGG